ncbi:uncharacterized protein DUF2642 [Natranaerovirga pectinivora]|uniref:Uncharacterized protein DUF2642 n=1 Tax=Natranaerovirga pectinivora TaxID=682400 RepID=A0A4R3MNW8_9FIRM|nr:YuzF family protein [Natranaerovirga pectinivora]TCT16212.1 uncharacterized protein DUF2642 [Natranaerovirga pectinivora]
MSYHLYQMPKTEHRQSYQYITLVDPYVVETLKTIIGRSAVIETVRGNLQGIIEDVMPDHIVVRSYDSDTTFYVRIQQIVHVMPT